MSRSNRSRKPLQHAAGRRGAAAEPPFRDVSVDRTTAIAALGIFAAVFALYAATAARDVVVGDTGEFMTVAATFGVAHPPGYPLLTILGHLLSLLPVGTLPFRMDLLSALGSAGAAAFTFLIARQFGLGMIASAIGALVLATDSLFWEWSLVLEAFPLNNLLVSALLYFLFRWEGQPASKRDLIIAALVAGLGASNHQTIIFTTPAILIVLWRRRSHVLGDPRLVATCLGATAIGFLPYAVIPWAASRHPFMNWANIRSFGDLAGHFLRREYGTANLAAPGIEAGPPGPRLALLAQSFTYVQLVLIPLGVVEAWRRHRWYCWSALLMFAIAGPMFAAYANMQVADVGLQWVLRRFFLLPHVVLAPLAAFGVVLLTGLAGRVMAGQTRAAEAVVAGAATLAILAGAILAYPHVDQSRNHIARNYAEDILSSLKPHAVLLAQGDDALLPLAYVQAVEHQRPDVTIIMLGILKGLSGTWYVPQLRQHDPTLVIPFDLYESHVPTENIKALIDANPGRPFAIIGENIDDSLKQSHWYYRHGLVQEILPLSADVTLDVAAAETDRLLHSYHLPDPKTVKYVSFESVILFNYAMSAKKIGDEYATAGMKPEAAAWYRRAIDIFPTLKGAHDALAGVSK
jgi:hypothetical protein